MSLNGMRQATQPFILPANRLSYPGIKLMSMLRYSVVIGPAILIGLMLSQTVLAEANDIKPLPFQAQGIAGAVEDDLSLQHKWTEVDPAHFVSQYPAPFPFSETGEPEAELSTILQTFSGSLPSLTEVVESEANDLRRTLNIVEYLEEDGHNPRDGIATYYEDIDGYRVGFIKYRFNGLIGKPSMLPQTVIHGIIVTKGKVWYIHLITRFSGHQDETRGDQIRIIKTIIRSDKNPG
jgi:hypothetical protein